MPSCLLSRSCVRRHRSEIVLGVLVVILCSNQITCLGFSLGQRQVPLIISLCVLRTLRLRARSVRGPPLWAGIKGRYRSWLVRSPFRRRSILHPVLLGFGRLKMLRTYATNRVGACIFKKKALNGLLCAHSQSARHTPPLVGGRTAATSDSCINWEVSPRRTGHFLKLIGSVAVAVRLPDYTGFM